MQVQVGRVVLVRLKDSYVLEWQVRIVQQADEPGPDLAPVLGGEVVGAGLPGGERDEVVRGQLSGELADLRLGTTPGALDVLRVAGLGGEALTP